jgi:hypothetical protein
MRIKELLWIILLSPISVLLAYALLWMTLGAAWSF